MNIKEAEKYVHLILESMEYYTGVLESVIASCDDVIFRSYFGKVLFSLQYDLTVMKSLLEFCDQNKLDQLFNLHIANPVNSQEDLDELIKKGNELLEE